MLVLPWIVLVKIVGAQGTGPNKSASPLFLRPSFYVQPSEPPPVPPCPPRTPRGGLRPRGWGSTTGRGFVSKPQRGSLDKPSTLRFAPSTLRAHRFAGAGRTAPRPLSIIYRHAHTISIDVLGRCLRFIPRASGAPLLLPVGSIVAVGRSVVGARPSPRRVVRLVESFNLFGGGL